VSKAKAKAKAPARAGKGKGWVRRGGFNPFWTPWIKGKGRKPAPAEVEGTVVGSREQEGDYSRKGKDGKTTKMRTIVSVKSSTGEVWDVDCGTSALATLADFDAGEPVRLVYLGERKVKGRKQPMHDVELYGQE